MWMHFDHCFFCLPLVSKEEVVQKARPVSTDVGSTNPNFSDLMDEFIQERLKAKGTAVSIAHSDQYGLRFLCYKFRVFALTNRVVVAAARVVWKSPGTCRSSLKQVRVLDRDPLMISALLTIQGFPLNGLRLQAPVALMSSAPTASQTPLMPFSILPASLTVRNNNKMWLYFHFYLTFISVYHCWFCHRFYFQLRSMWGRSCIWRAWRRRRRWSRQFTGPG